MALLNWLILSGWGVGHNSPAPEGVSKPRSPNSVPDSTKIMTLGEMIDQVRMPHSTSFEVDFFRSLISLPSLIATQALKHLN